MEHHFDPKMSARRFDDPARDAWQMPDRVIATLALQPGQIVVAVGSGTGHSQSGSRKRLRHPTCTGQKW
jgi:hypothetical protein